MIIAFGIIITLSFIQPLLYRKFPSDNDRHIVILDLLNEDNKTENIIVFGDSRTMFGVDTRIIRDDMNLPYEVYNLSSVGQSLYESSYFYGLINKNTRAVIQCSSPEFFSDDLSHKLQNDKAFSMILSGYSLSESTKLLIKDYNKIFDRNVFINYFESRSVIKSYIHSNILVPLFDNEVSDRYARHSIYFPHSFVTKQHPDYPVYKYDCTIYKNTERPISQLSFLKTVRNYFKIKGIGYVIVFMPVNPDECNECYQNFKVYKDLIEETTNIHVIDLTDLILDTKYFYDAQHANKDGAKIISSEIARKLLIDGFKLEEE